MSVYTELILCQSSADSLSFHTWKSDHNSAVKIMSLFSHLRSSRVEETGHRFTSKHWVSTLELMRPYVETFKTFMTSVEIIFLLAADCRLHITPSCIQPAWKIWRQDRKWSVLNLECCFYLSWWCNVNPADSIFIWQLFKCPLLKFMKAFGSILWGLSLVHDALSAS